MVGSLHAFQRGPTERSLQFGAQGRKILFPEQKPGKLADLQGHMILRHRRGVESGAHLAGTRAGVEFLLKGTAVYALPTAGETNTVLPLPPR
ncbi:MAG: hypothetical protein WD490_07830 [Opitutales bacterium]